MTRYRNNLPQLGNGLFLTDGGLETTLVFHDGLDLPLFAAFDLLKNPAGRARIKSYMKHYTAIAVHAQAGFILESPTWRANHDWAKQLGYSSEQLDLANRDAIALMEEIREEYELPSSPFVISGCVGPRGDGYAVDSTMSIIQARDYHRAQIQSFANSAADMVSAITMTYPEEAAGIALAARETGMPVVISFTTETDGYLPNGVSLQSAIETVDKATNNAPVYYMINCAHPDHFTPALTNGEHWINRIGGIRANASRCSHAELDNATVLDDGDPVELGALYQRLLPRLPGIKVVGGCCGTDHRHIQAISNACIAA